MSINYHGIYIFKMVLFVEWLLLILQRCYKLHIHCKNVNYMKIKNEDSHKREHKKGFLV